MVMESLLGAVQELSWMDYVAMLIVGFIVYRKIFRPLIFGRDELPKPEPQLPPLPKKDMTLQELRRYDGQPTSMQEGRICLAVDGKIFDVTRGKHNYGPDGPYGVFAGRDASRGLATMDLSANALRDEYDSLDGLSESEIDSMKEWSSTFSMRYPFVGKLLKPDETPTKYGDNELASFLI